MTQKVDLTGSWVGGVPKRPAASQIYCPSAVSDIAINKAYLKNEVPLQSFVSLYGPRFVVADAVLAVPVADAREVALPATEDAEARLTDSDLTEATLDD